MQTVRSAIETRIAQSPYLRDALGQGLINVSALARHIHDDVEAQLRKAVSHESVFMALKRHTATLTDDTEATPPSNIGELSLRTELFQLTIANSPRLLSTITTALSHTPPSDSAFLTFTKAVHETTITASTSLRENINTWLGNERVVARREGLTALSLRRPSTATDNRLDHPLRLLSWSGITLIDVISTTHELTVIVDDTQVALAIDVLRKPAATGRQIAS